MGVKVDDGNICILLGKDENDENWMFRKLAVTCPQTAESVITLTLLCYIINSFSNKIKDKTSQFQSCNWAASVSLAWPVPHYVFSATNVKLCKTCTYIII